jgi:hypothetical protein
LGLGFQCLQPLGVGGAVQAVQQRVLARGLDVSSYGNGGRPLGARWQSTESLRRGELRGRNGDCDGEHDKQRNERCP